MLFGWIPCHQIIIYFNGSCVNSEIQSVCIIISVYHYTQNSFDSDMLLQSYSYVLIFILRAELIETMIINVDSLLHFISLHCIMKTSVAG